MTRTCFAAIAAAALLAAPTLAAEETEDAAPVLQDPYLTAVAIGVSDIAASKEFYMTGLGYVEMRTIELDTLTEVLLRMESSEAVLVLQTFTDGREVSYDHLPVRLVYRVPDPVAFAEQIQSAGGTVETMPAANDEGGVSTGFARDPDGYLIEILRSRPVE